MNAEDRGLAGRRVLITGAARSIGKLTAERLHQRGARVAVIGLETELLEQVAIGCGNAPWRLCDVSDRAQVDEAVEAMVDALGGLDVVVANAGIGAQLPIVGGDPEIFERTIAVNLLGAYYTVRAAGAHIAHDDGYALLTASLAAAVHPPLMGAYSASKAGVEALGGALRAELQPTGARAGVAYFAELDTDMTARAFNTEAAARSPLGGHGRKKVAPVGPAIDAIERGIRRRSRRIASPSWVRAVLPFRQVAQPLVELAARKGLAKTLDIARSEHAPLTTPQADGSRNSPR